MTCPNCRSEVAEGNFCVRCGHPLVEGKAAIRTRYAAVPHEKVWTPALVSTLFPQLPRADLRTFRLSLALAAAVLVILAIAGLFPLALVTASVVTPMLFLLYLVDVDVYEDEPLRVMVMTALAGAAGGVAVGFLGRVIAPPGAESLLESTGSRVLLRGGVLPILSVAVMLLGPLYLLRYPRFNDVLDGVTFGAASAVCFAGAQLLVQSVSVFDSGLRPVGQVVPWVLTVLRFGLAVPILLGAVVGAASGALWLRYRAPVRDRTVLGPLGRPAAALGLAVVVVVGAALVQQLTGPAISLVVLGLLDLAGLLALRRVIHLGLLQEAAEVEAGPEIDCGNCGERTPRFAFCRNCGISLLALPKERWPRPTEGSAIEREEN